jgi:flagellar basal-body rod protein FlgC
MINTIQIALSGLVASMKKLDASASNIANLSTVGSLDEQGIDPYTPITTAQSSLVAQDGISFGVDSETIPKTNPYIPTYDPDSPFADQSGIIGVPNINLAEEAINIKIAALTFKANASIIEKASEMHDELINIFDEEV